MKTLFWIVAMGVAGALWYGRRRHAPPSTEDLPPRWLNEHAYERGKNGDRRWR